MNRDLNPQKAGSDSKPPWGRLQAGQPSVTFCGKETQRNKCAGDFCKKAAASDIKPAATWRRWRDSNSRTTFNGYTISNRAPSTGLGDISVRSVKNICINSGKNYYNLCTCKNQVFFMQEGLSGGNFIKKCI